MTYSFRGAIDLYLKNCKRSSWIRDESYKFQFANYVHTNIDWQTQTDDTIFAVMINSQKIRYIDSTGIQFIIKSGRRKPGEFILLDDVRLLRQLNYQPFSEIDWSTKTMSYTGLSAWIASLFPEKFYPVPMTGFDQTIKFLFGVADANFPRKGEKYILGTQKYMHETWETLSLYPIEDLFLTQWNDLYTSHPEFKVSEKDTFNQIDKVWLAQDFHLFVHREILKLYSKKTSQIKIQEIFDPIAIEGNSILAQHLRYERNSAFIHKIKDQAIRENKFLNCQICGFSFLETYGDLGAGFIEAHHLNAISKSLGIVKTTKNDIALVCSNCHRMLHREDLISPDDLMQIIRKK